MSLAIIKRLDEAEDKFLAIYRAVHKCSDEDAKNFFEVEKFAFRRAFEETPALAECTDLSIAGCFLEVISNGLSFDKSAKHVYLIPRSVNVAPKGQAPQWQKRLTYSYAADGVIYLCTSAGSIASCTPPVIVYEGDHIEVQTIDGKMSINHSPAIPRASKTILGGFVFVTEKSGEREAFWMSVEEMERAAGYSAKANKGTANELYSSGPDGQVDAGFFATKIVKAALKNKRKKRTVSDNHFDELEAMDNESPLLVETVETPQSEGIEPTPNGIIEPSKGKLIEPELAF